jgi:hypothetical protein
VVVAAFLAVTLVTLTLWVPRMQFRRSCCDLVLVEEATEPVTPTNRGQLNQRPKAVTFAGVTLKAAR